MKNKNTLIKVIITSSFVLTQVLAASSAMALVPNSNVQVQTQAGGHSQISNLEGPLSRQNIVNIMAQMKNKARTLGGTPNAPSSNIPHGCRNTRFGEYYGPLPGTYRDTDNNWKISAFFVSGPNRDSIREVDFRNYLTLNLPTNGIIRWNATADYVTGRNWTATVTISNSSGFYNVTNLSYEREGDTIQFDWMVLRGYDRDHREYSYMISFDQPGSISEITYYSD